MSRTSQDLELIQDGKSAVSRDTSQMTFDHPETDADDSITTLTFDLGLGCKLVIESVDDDEMQVVEVDIPRVVARAEPLVVEAVIRLFPTATIMVPPYEN